MFNVGLGVLAGFAAVLVMTPISPPGHHDGKRAARRRRSAVPPIFLVDFLVSASLHRARGRDAGPRGLRQGNGLAGARCLRGHRQPRSTSPPSSSASCPPYASAAARRTRLTILVATRALTRGSEHRRRLGALFDAAAEAQVVKTTRSALETVLRTHAKAAVAQPGVVDLRSAGPPRSKEIGALVRTGGRAAVAGGAGDPPGARLRRGRPGRRSRRSRRSARRRSPGSGSSTRWAGWRGTTR